MAWLITIALNPTMGVAWHRFSAFFNIWFKRNATGEVALGPLQPMVSRGKPIDFEDPADDDVFGVGVVENFTWKGLLDFSTCTECGRCQSQCPAWNTGKPLSPKLLIMSLRDHAAAKAPYLLAGGGLDAEGNERATAGAARRRAGQRDRRGGPPAGRDARGRRRDRPRGALVVHDLRGLRRAVPGRHRARRPHPRHASLPGADRVVVPERGEQPAEEPGKPAEPVGHAARRPYGLGRGGRLPGPGVRHGRRGQDPGGRRVSLLGRLRRRPGRPRQEDHEGVRRAAPHRRRRVHGARRGRGMLRGSGPPTRQRVRVRDARPAERRDAQRGRRPHDRRNVPALLQHARERVPATRWHVRRDPPHATAVPPRRPRVACCRSARSTSS